jgi:polysaccharide pyruvyl transferase WcaK-like protein
MLNVVAPFGFYGAGNIGDEATLQGFARLVSRCPHRLRVWVGSRNPYHTSKIEPSFRYFQPQRRDWRLWWVEKRASAVVFAGGTPIMDGLGDWPLCEVAPLTEDAYRGGKSVAFVGIGTEGLERQESRRIVREQLGRWVRQWTVRSLRDQERLTEYGVPPERIHVAADMAWLLDPVSADWGRRQLEAWGVASQPRLIGVNLLGEKNILAREPRLFEKLAEFLDVLVETHDLFVLFLANEVRAGETFDTTAAQWTRAAMKRQQQTFIAPNEYLAPQQMLSLIANCHATVSMRYHFCLFSALQGVPFFALQRSDKVADLCFDLDWAFGVGLRNLQVASAIALFDVFEQLRSAAIDRLNTQLAVLRNRAYTNLISFESLLTSTHRKSVKSRPGSIREFVPPPVIR